MSKDFCVVIPARGGSRRVPRKNVRPLGGKPLLCYAIAAALEAGVCDRVHVSTDCEEMAGVAAENGAAVIMRPAELATDEASTESALLHALDSLGMPAGEDAPRWIMTLPPTSPFRGAANIRQAARMAAEADESVDAIFTVHEHRGDFWRGDPLAPGFSRLFPGAPRRTQDREPLWEENSAIYLTRVSALRRTGFILGTNPRGLPISPLAGLDINTELDFAVAESLLDAASAEKLI